jgi:hypothetical protein
MNAKTVSERVSEMRTRRKADGLVKLELWVHEKDVTRIKKEAELFAKRRARALKDGIVIRSLEDEQAHYAAMAKRITKEKK